MIQEFLSEISISNTAANVKGLLCVEGDGTT
jgi:hypothetical protein